jgi:hypothetical protein
MIYCWKYLAPLVDYCHRWSIVVEESVEWLTVVLPKKVTVDVGDLRASQPKSGRG